MFNPIIIEFFGRHVRSDHCAIKEKGNAGRLKTLRGLTPSEFIHQVWTKEPERFRLNPSHHPGTIHLRCRLNQVIQKQTLATRAMAERKFLARRSERVAMRRQSFIRQNIRSMTLRPR
jgi:hypothetical protein